MPQIIVAVDHDGRLGHGTVMHRERVNLSDFESEHFARQLVERISWAVSDAHEVQQQTDERGPQQHEPQQHEPQQHEPQQREPQQREPQPHDPQQHEPHPDEPTAEHVPESTPAPERSPAAEPAGVGS